MSGSFWSFWDADDAGSTKLLPCTKLTKLPQMMPNQSEELLGLCCGPLWDSDKVCSTGPFSVSAAVYRGYIRILDSGFILMKGPGYGG